MNVFYWKILKLCYTSMPVAGSVNPSSKYQDISVYYLNKIRKIFDLEKIGSPARIRTEVAGSRVLHD